MSTDENLDIRAVIVASLSEFFERILSMKVEVDEGDLLAVLEGEGFVVVVELAGELAGRLDIKVGSDFAVLMAASMLGGTIEDVDADHEVPDLLDEMADFLGRKLKENCGLAGIECEISKTEIITKDDLLESSAPLQHGSRCMFKCTGHEGWVDFQLVVGETQKAPPADETIDSVSTKDEHESAAASETPGSRVRSEKGTSVLSSDGGKEISLELEPLDEDEEGEDADDFEGLSEDEEDISGLLPDITDPGDETEALHAERISQSENDLPENNAKSEACSAGEVKCSLDGEVLKEGISDEGQFEGLCDDEEDFCGKPFLGKCETEDSKPSVETLRTLNDNVQKTEGSADAFSTGDFQESEDEESESDHSPGKRGRKGFFWMAAAMLVVVVIGGWIFMLHRQRGLVAQSLTTVEIEKEKSVTVSATKSVAADTRKQSLSEVLPTAEVRLSSILTEAQNLKEALLGKLEEVLRLKQYFRDGIADVRSQVAARVQNNGIRAYPQAIKDQRIELDLRTIQRRLAAIDELSRPINWLVHAAEDVDYGIRKTRIDLTMAPFTAGADLKQLYHNLEVLTRQYALTDDRLLIDGQSIEARPLAAIWQEMMAPVKKVAWLQGAGNGVKGNFVNWAGSAVNRRIWQEVCQDNFSHLSDLTMISSEAASCLADDQVKDLFLSELKELPGAAARNLAKWNGSWLVLNGLSSISPAAARQLASWQGACLSLNGLVELSPQAAGALSRWKGRQLELINLAAKGGKVSLSVLKSLKSWETGGRRLFVSPKVRKVLDRL